MSSVRYMRKGEPMPIYEFYCSDCRRKFELLTSYAASVAGARCPTCEGQRVRKLFSVFARGGRAGGGSDFDYDDGGDYEASAGGCSCGGACSCGGH